MKRRKYWLLVALAVLFTFNACMQMPQSSAAVSETPSAVKSEVTTINLEDQYDENELIEILSRYSEDGIAWIMRVNEYPSPDKTQKFIEVSASEGTPDSWAGDRNFVFLNDLDHLFYTYDDIGRESVGAVWINNDTVAIAADFIVNLKTGERKNMGDPMINDKLDGLTKWRMCSGLYIEELDSLTYITYYDLVFYLFQYNLKDGTWTELADRPFETGHDATNYLHFKRENENEISFNTEKKQRLSFNFYTKEFREIPYVGVYYGESSPAPSDLH